MTRQIVMENPDEGIFRKLNSVMRRDKLILKVDWRKNENKIFYSIFSRDGFGSYDPEPLEITESALVRCSDQTDELLNQIIPRIPKINTSSNTWDNICNRLQGFGESLFEQLLPCGVQEYSRRWNEGFLVEINTNETLIPWELLHDGQDFWGKKFIIGRAPRYKPGQAPIEDREQNDHFIEVQRILNVVGGGEIISGTLGDRAASLFDCFSSRLQVELLREIDFSTLSNSSSKVNILHCTCHGYRGETALLQIDREGMPNDNNICIETVKRLQVQTGSLVFLNACTSNAPSPFLDGFTSFGWEFYKRHVKVTIGTLGIIPVEFAVEFAECFYKELFREQEENISNGNEPQLNSEENIKESVVSIGEALDHAKRAFADKKRNFFWLLYSIYGDPESCFIIPKI